jgi:surfeit locus 1 family protein
VSAVRRALLWQGAVASLACAALVWLGVWQMQRLAWKDNLVARIAARARAAPAALPAESEWPRLAPEEYEYRHVRLSGVFDHAKQALVFRGSADGKAGAGGPGHLVLTPLRLADGAIVIVNRGFVPLALRDAARRAAGPQGVVELTGLMRPPEPRNAFTPDDAPAKGEWFTRDPAAVAAHFGLTRVAPYPIDAAAGPPGASPPNGGATVLDIPNNHLSYALTWFGLAATLAAVFGVYARRRIGGGDRASRDS